MRMTCRREVFAAVLAVLLLGGCGHALSRDVTGGEPFDFAQKRECIAAQAKPGQVEVRYLGSGGVYIEWRGDAILIGPSFSNPSVLRAAFWKAKFDEGRIGRALEPLESTGNLRKVRAILAGHSHYDHIGDLPVVAMHGDLKEAAIYVNASGMNMLHTEPKLLARAKKLVAGSEYRVGTSFIVRPILSSHAPAVCGFWRRWPCVYAGGAVTTRWSGRWTDHLLRTFRGGDTLAFEIELLGGTRPYRIYYNDAASDGVPQVSGNTDLAILCMAQWNRARDYPRALIGVLQPKHVVISHWDNFFSKAEGTSTFVPFLGAKGFLGAVNQHVAGGTQPVNQVCGAGTPRWTMPVVGSALVFDVR